MLNVMSYYPLETGRALLKSAQKISIEFPDLHYNRATVLKYLEEYCAAPFETSRGVKFHLLVGTALLSKSLNAPKL
jgi:hypothetical protein